MVSTARGKDNMKLTFQEEAVKAAPAIGGAILSGITLNQCVALATLLYILIQIGYLLWKWHKEARS